MRRPSDCDFAGYSLPILRLGYRFIKIHVALSIGKACPKTLELLVTNSFKELLNGTRRD